MTTRKQAEAKARKIARDLFTDGCGKRSQRLVMDYAGDGGDAGLCEQAVADRIAAALLESPPTATGEDAEMLAEVKAYSTMFRLECGWVIIDPDGKESTLGYANGEQAKFAVEQLNKGYRFAYLQLNGTEETMREAVFFEYAKMFHENPQRPAGAPDGRTPLWYMKACAALGLDPNEPSKVGGKKEVVCDLCTLKAQRQVKHAAPACPPVVH